MTVNVPVDGPGLVGGKVGEPVEPRELAVLPGGGPLLPALASQHLNLDQTDQCQTSGSELLIRHKQKVNDSSLAKISLLDRFTRIWFCKNHDENFPFTWKATGMFKC